MSMDQYFHGIDDVDVAFARLERVPPPASLRMAVLHAVAARARARRRLGYRLLSGALAAAAVLSFLFGQQLRSAGAFEVLDVAIANLDLFAAAPAELALAVGETVPWLLVVPILCCFGVIVWGTRLALSPAVRFTPRQEQ